MLYSLGAPQHRTRLKPHRSPAIPQKQPPRRWGPQSCVRKDLHAAPSALPSDSFLSGWGSRLAGGAPSSLADW